MNRRRIFAGLFLLVAGGVLIFWVAAAGWGSRQPTLENRTVTEWSLDLLSPYHPTRTNATRVLQSFGPEAAPVLVRQLHRRESWLRAPFLAISSHLPVTWRRAFIRFGQPFRPGDERLAASAALPFLGTNVPVHVLFETLRGTDRRFANQAAQALGRYGPAAVPGLTTALRDPNPEVRRLACYALSQLGEPAAPAAAGIAALLSDADPRIMALAAYTLAAIGPSSIPYLIDALDHPQPRVREKAIDSLAQLRFNATNALPALERLLDDEDAAVRRHTLGALRAIAPRWSGEFGARHPPRDF